MDIYYVPSNLTVRAVSLGVMERALDLEATGLSSSLHKYELSSCVVSLYCSISISPLKKESEGRTHRNYEDQIQQHVIWHSFFSCLSTDPALTTGKLWCLAASQSGYFSCIFFLYGGQNPSL